MFVGIVLPIYNQRPDYIEECLDSLEKQRYRRFKLAIVLDGSDERTAQAVAEAAYRLSVSYEIIRRYENRGIAHSLNEGFERLRDCPYLTWISSDNRYDPGFLLTLAEALSFEAGPASLAYSLFRYIDEEGRPRTNPAEDRLPMTRHMDRPAEHILQSNFIGPSFLFARDAYDRAGGYDPRYETAEDYEFWLRLSGTGRFRFIPEFLMDYRLNGPFAVTANTPQLDIQLKSVQASVDHRQRIGDIPQATVILMAHNKEKFVSAAIESILRQSGAAFHLLLIDNGSVDRTLYKMHSFQDPRIMLLRLAERRNGAELRKLALRLALGSYVLELEGRERLLSGELARLLDSVQRHPARGRLLVRTAGANRRGKTRSVFYRNPLQQ